MNRTRLGEGALLGAVALLASASWGCSSGSSDDTSTQNNAGAPFELEFHLDDVPPGVEGTKCRQVRLPNADTIAISRIVNDISSSSHHFVVSSITPDPAKPETMVEQPEPQDCRPFQAPLLGSPLAITQKHHDAYDLPSGVGYELGPNQMIHLELHYINTGTEPTSINARTQLFPLGAGELQNRASVMVVGNLAVTIPPNTDHTLGPTFADVPATHDGVSIYAMTGHTHRYGTNVQVSTVDLEGGEPTPRYDLENFVWDAPEVVTFSPAFKVAAEGGFTYSCTWHNPTAEPITFGESATQEMCFFWVYYYPAKPGRALLLAGLNRD